MLHRQHPPTRQDCKSIFSDCIRLTPIATAPRPARKQNKFLPPPPQLVLLAIGTSGIVLQLCHDEYARTICSSSVLEGVTHQKQLL